jgi:competence protein ComEA
MVRPNRAAQLDERSQERGRLEAMRLRAAVPGWVPGPPVDPSVRDPEPVAVSAPVQTSAAVPTSAVVPTVGELARAWAIDRAPLCAQGSLERVRLPGLAMGLAVLVAAIVAGVLVFHHHNSTTGYSYAPSGPSSTVASSAAAPTAPVGGADTTSIVVDVGGRVHKPGLVTLPPGARVADAIAAAGGPLHHKEIATLDLAARVSDGQLLLIGVPDSATTAGGSDGGADPTAGGAPAPVDLDSATIDQLETLPGVGPVTAQKILDWRTAHGGFTTVAQLAQVSGIGPARYAELSPLVIP